MHRIALGPAIAKFAKLTADHGWPTITVGPPGDIPMTFTPEGVRNRIESEIHNVRVWQAKLHGIVGQCKLHLVAFKDLNERMNDFCKVMEEELEKM